MSTPWDYNGDGFQPERMGDNDCEHLHVCKDGTVLYLHEIDDDHLRNIIRLYERKAKEGLTVPSYGGGWNADSFFYEEDVLYGEDALQHLHHDLYVAELKRRGLDRDCKPASIVNVV